MGGSAQSCRGCRDSAMRHHGLEVLKVSEPKRHHIIPASYLEGFRDPDPENGSSIRVWVYRIPQEHGPFLVSPTNVAVEKFFNTFELDTGERNYSAEVFLADEIDVFIRHWRELPTAQLDTLPLQDRADIANYVTHLWLRTQHTRDQFVEFIASIEDPHLADEQQQELNRVFKRSLRE